MSIIPSFILSALIFCNASVSGDWKDTAFSEGIICRFPYAGITLSLDENANERMSLKNAAAVFEDEKLSLKLAAGSLAVTGASGFNTSSPSISGGADTLSASLPGKDASKKPLSFFGAFKSFSLLAQENRVFSQLLNGHSDASFQNALSAGWTRIKMTADDSWFLRYPWHPGGNLVSLSNTLTSRVFLQNATLKAAGTAAFSLPDRMQPAAGGKLDLLFTSEREQKGTEAALSVSAAPAYFMTADGSFIPETFAMTASYAYRSRPNPPASPADKASVTFKACAGFAQKQPSEAKQPSKRFFSAELSLAYSADAFSAAASLSADRFCFEDAFSEGTLSPALELSLSALVLSAKGTFKPFALTDDGYLEPCEWSVKAGFSEKSLSASYTVDFTGSIPETQSVAVTHADNANSLKTTLSMKKESLSWTLSFAHNW